MTTFRLGLVGAGIDKSLAPAFHELAGEHLGLEVRYDLLPRDPDHTSGLEDTLRELAVAGYQGLNVTVPFKALVWKGVPEPGPEVVASGVANTLLLGPDGPSHAFNTDFSGFKWAWQRRFGDTAPGAVALLGAGGVGSATAVALADLGASALRLYDLVPERSHQLAESLRRRDGGVQVEVAASAGDAVAGVDGVVNGTPVGMYWNPGTPVDLGLVGGAQRWVFDAIYSPVETPLMVRAAELGLDRITGLDLFLGQAIDAFTLFTGRTLDPQVLAEVEARIDVLERHRGV